MITIDAPISFMIGGALALAGKAPNSDRIAGRDVLLLRVLLFQGVVLTPLILYFMVRFPDWEWNYMFDAGSYFFAGGVVSARAALTLALIAAALHASCYAGFRVVEGLVARGKAKIAWRVIVATAVLIGAIMAGMYRQTLHLGSYAEFQAGRAPLAFTVPEFLLVQAVAGVLVAGGIAWIVKLQRGA